MNRFKRVYFFRKYYNLKEENLSDFVSDFDNDVNFFEKNDYIPTKEEFDKLVLQIQKNELSTDRYLKVFNFMIDYAKRKNFSAEFRLFELLNSFCIDDEMNNISYKGKIKYYNTCLTRLEKYISSLSDVQIESNLYLKLANIFIKNSCVVCDKVFPLLEGELTRDTSYDGKTRLDFEIEIVDEKLSLIPERIPLKRKVKYYNPSIFDTVEISLLDNRHKKIYEDYNAVSCKIIQLVLDIYFLQLWNYLQNSSVFIDDASCDLKIDNNKVVFSFVFLVNNNKVEYDSSFEKKKTLS